MSERDVHAFQPVRRTRRSRTSRRGREGSSAKSARASFVAGLNENSLVAATLALAGAIAALLLIRSSDFVTQTEAQPDGQTSGKTTEPARA